ncbi:hypothetical protein ABID21_003961 [Pseudorhizobium tarimense]|uniref:Uncharacterized protein n=1 Tax=Pseudorhizobium tarimense TaxID=1079109 RepID=A0ABV2HBA4_9HYPH
MTLPFLVGSITPTTSALANMLGWLTSGWQPLVYGGSRRSRPL